jgi:hypothetical protein
LDLQLPVPSLPITTNVLSLNLAHGEVCSIQHYVMKFVGDLRRVSGLRQIKSRQLTWNDKVGKPTKLPNHDKTALTNSNMAINAIRLAAMLATNLMEADAPAAAGEVCSIQHYVMKFVSDLRQVSGFIRLPPPMQLIAWI